MGLRFSMMLAAGLAVVTNLTYAPNGVAEVTTKKEQVGLVLAGGGALGFAHVGVLKVLREQNVKIDIVTGTSMGSIVGAAFASGKTIEELEEVVASTDWEKLFSESVPRPELPYKVKPGIGRDIKGDAKLAFKNGELQLPTGAVQGLKIVPLLQQVYNKYPGYVDFDQLPVRFRAVAANIENGQPVILSKGELALAARASMSVPGAFSPVEIDGQILVDGGIANNLPMDVARSLGATRLVVVELPATFKKADELTNPLAIVGQISSLLLAQNARAQLSTLSDRDVLVLPDLKGYSPTDFNKAAELIKIGEEAARKVIPQLKTLSVSPDDYQLYNQRRTGTTPPEVKIDFIKVENNKAISTERIVSDFGIEPGNLFDPKQVEEGLTRVYNSNDFANVRYSLVEENGKSGLLLNVEEKSWISSYARAGFSVQDDVSGNSDYSLALGFFFNDITDLGTDAEFDFSLGFNPRATFKLEQPFGAGSPWFIAPLVEIEASPINITTADGDTISKYTRKVVGGTVKLGRYFDEYGAGWLGFERYSGDLTREIGSLDLPTLDYQVANLIAGFEIDTLDSVDFPHNGARVFGRVRSSSEELGADSEFQQLYMTSIKPFTIGSTTIAAAFEGGLTLDNLPVEQSFVTGGFLSFSGYPINSLIASDFAVAKLISYRQLFSAGSTFLGVAGFAGGSLELGSFKSDSGIGDRGVINAGSIFAGVDTPVLPIYFGFGLAEEGIHSFYFSLGRILQSRR